MSAFIFASGGWPAAIVVDASRVGWPFGSRLTLTLTSPPAAPVTDATTSSSSPIVESSSSLHAASFGLAQPAATVASENEMSPDSTLPSMFFASFKTCVSILLRVPASALPSACSTMT